MYRGWEQLSLNIVHSFEGEIEVLAATGYSQRLLARKVKPLMMT